jgi:DNA-binding XRE family transcriptional regulator
MKRKKLEALQAAGWRVGTAEQFLDLSEAEAGLVEMKLALADGLRELRHEATLTQAEVAEIIGSSQSRVAKMEAADPSVSMDLLIRTLLRLGSSAEAVATLVTNRRRRKGAV